MFKADDVDGLPIFFFSGVNFENQIVKEDIPGNDILYRRSEHARITYFLTLFHTSFLPICSKAEEGS